MLLPAHVQLSPSHPLTWILQAEGQPAFLDAIQALDIKDSTKGWLQCAEIDASASFLFRILQQYSLRFLPELGELLSFRCKCSNKCGILTNTLLPVWSIELVNIAITMFIHLISDNTLYRCIPVLWPHSLDREAKCTCYKRYVWARSLARLPSLLGRDNDDLPWMETVEVSMIAS